MFLLNFAIFLIMLTSVKCDLWKVPTAIDIQAAFETCEISNEYFLNAEENYDHDSNDIRCFTKHLGLWTDEEGFQAKRLIKLLKKYQQPIEIVVVIGYCNRSHKQINNPDRWANEAYQCFAKGRIGQWINEYVKNVYKNKITTK
ncbi:uncharacterized protein LOC111690533 [Lucilia cuprina]|uniref:uncharacterized protein LOC111690533 n=1 Tax=Lucilia cuprina TaxID=7375 RepID=UPI001F061949|nr:uncharacterized protein LOC111690533 [Lucilia cuprina]